VKEFFEDRVKIWLNYDHEFGVHFFGQPCIRKNGKFLQHVPCIKADFAQFIVKCDKVLFSGYSDVEV